MNKVKKIVFTSILFLYCFVHITYAGPRPGYQDPICSYQSSLGPKIESYSKAWNTKEKLMQINKELMKNYVSSEISKLKYIYIYPDIEDGVSGYYNPDVIVSNSGYYSMGENSYIVLLGCDESSSTSQIAKTLSHEYGHHFTTYYIVTNEHKYGNGWINSNYAKIRGLSSNAQVKNYNSISGNSKWDISEIAAWDYVQLFGSNSTKYSTDYKDVEERANGGYSNTSYLSTNAYPQENLDLPLATMVPGLYDYWMSMAGGATSRPKSNYTPTLNVTKKYLTNGKYNLYELRWDSMQGDNYEYTVIMYPSTNSSRIIPIKTTYQNEENVCYIGTYAGNRTLIETYQGTYVIRLFVKDSNGFIYEGKCTYINFNENLKPKVVYSTIFTDLPKNHWAYNYIISLYNNKIVSGYADKTYAPEGNITRKEFIALLMRVSNLNVSKYKKLSNDWFVRDGYLAAAKAYGIISTRDYGANYSNLKLNGNITRQEIGFMIGRLLLVHKYTSDSKNNYASKFSDLKSNKYKTEINLALKKGILSGYPDQKFKPLNNATRAEVAKVIYKTNKLLG